MVCSRSHMTCTSYFCLSVLICHLLLMRAPLAPPIADPADQRRHIQQLAFTPLSSCAWGHGHMASNSTRTKPASQKPCVVSLICHKSPVSSPAPLEATVSHSWADGARQLDWPCSTKPRPTTENFGSTSSVAGHRSSIWCSNCVQN